jgi:hypothetical protein
MDRDAVGYALTLAGTFLAAAGYVLQKAAHVANERALIPVPSWRQWRWTLGLVCMIASAGLVVAASPFLNQSQSAPLGAATLVFNILLASLILRERFTVLAALATLVILAGTVVAVSSAEASTAFTFVQVLGLLRDPLVAGYSVAIGFGMGGAAWWVERVSKRPDKTWSGAESAIFGVLAPALGGWANGFTSYAAKALTTAAATGEMAGALSGSVGGGAIYAYVALVSIAVVLQVRYLNKGLEHFTALATVPIFQASIIVSNSVTGIVYFGDLRGSSTPEWRGGVFAIGALLCCGGIILLRLQRAEDKAASGGAAATSESQSSEAAAIAEWGVPLPGGEEVPKAAPLHEVGHLTPLRAASASARAGAALTAVDCLNLSVAEAARLALKGR